ncbi:MAG TPA: hypothetical protein VN947_14755 [Polyangia bacterium]|nr:hypothetical protein [Polyangia bacterium]
MRRFVTIACALGLWALPAAAQESLQLSPPEMSARAERCTPDLRTRCEGVGERALDRDLACDACQPMPADVIAPESTPAATPRTTSPECLPRASGEVPASCADAPRLDHIPRP